MFFKPQQLHFTGIGGIGMSGIAEILLNLGYQITGSDIKLSPTTERLARLGARIHEGHAAENITGAKAVVVTSALDSSNPEVQEARRLGIPVIPRGELLAAFRALVAHRLRELLLLGRHSNRHRAVDPRATDGTIDGARRRGACYPGVHGRAVVG